MSFGSVISYNIIWRRTCLVEKRSVEGRKRSGLAVDVGEDSSIDGVVLLTLAEVEVEEEVVEVNGLSEREGRDGRDRGDWGEEMLEKRMFERWRRRWRLVSGHLGERIFGWGKTRSNSTAEDEQNEEGKEDGDGDVISAGADEKRAEGAGQEGN
ncbi:uncharacterized protein MONOS_17468 [Monocercomonoides exilis]|uniref:uncharacterized protein n=1 Tax=Monocercomonoides exilis TaxID=2049356 RepID=UPI00355A5D4C|nr:hypothetical protein MONOS_17468 [Monocercomonoides exilis]